jgi:hypothetical protein
MTRARRLLFGSGSNFAHYALGQAVCFRLQSEFAKDELGRRCARSSMRQNALMYTREILALQGKQFRLLGR